MYSNFDKRQELARQTQTVQTFRRIRRGIGAVRNSRAKLIILASLWIMAGIIWLTRHPMMGYGPDTPLAPVLDALTVIVLLLLTAALSLALLWAWGGPWQAGQVQDNLLRIGLVNAVGEPPTLLSVTVNPGNPKVRDYTFYTCGIPVSAWLDCADKIQSALNGSIADISYGEDNQTVTLSLAPPATKWPERIVWYDRNVSLENFVLTLGESQLGPVTVDLRTNAHILLGGVTGSGKTVLLKVLLRQAIDKGARVYIADFKGGVDFKSWFRENCCMSYDMDTTLKTLAEWENELDRRKTLLRDSNCSNIDEYNAMFTETKLHRWAFACDEIAMMLDKTGQSKEQKEKIDSLSWPVRGAASASTSFWRHRGRTRTSCLPRCAPTSTTVCAAGRTVSSRPSSLTALPPPNSSPRTPRACLCSTTAAAGIPAQPYSSPTSCQMAQTKEEVMENKKYTNIEQLPLVLSVEQLADVLGIGLNNAYQLVRSSSIRSVRIGRQYKIPKDALEVYLTA